MDKKTLYQTILDLTPPWAVVEVELEPAEEVVEVEVESRQRRWPCPSCKAMCSQHDTRPRRWRHFDSCQFQNILRAKIPRVQHWWRSKEWDSPLKGMKHLWLTKGSGLSRARQ